MSDHTTVIKATTDLDLNSLDQASDEVLAAVIEKATALLKQRETERTRTAVAHIKAYAKEHGLNVVIEPPRKKRGRKPKTNES